MSDEENFVYLLYGERRIIGDETMVYKSVKERVSFG